MWQWSDSTVVFYNRYPVLLGGEPACTLLSRKLQTGTFIPAWHQGFCDGKGDVARWLSGSFLCEVTNIVAHVEPLSFHLNATTNHSVSNATSPTALRLAVCPSREMTFTFLACQHTCWAKGYGTVYTCHAPVTPAPPMFLCSDEVERVSHSVLCDHRPDCSDSSDEDFCVFPTCGLGEVSCGMKQVSAICLS